MEQMGNTPKVVENKLTQSQIKADRDRLTHEQYLNTNMKIFRSVIYGSKLSEQLAKPLQLSKKKKNLVIKVRAAVSCLTLVNNVLQLTQSIRNPLKPNYFLMEELRKKAQESSEEDDLLIQSTAPISDKIKKTVVISSKTKKIITDF